jgi:nucleoside-diphosphate-sugar epimerase
MIIGNGLIAKAFIESGFNHNDYVIFASGVSNSNETDRKEFLREHTLLLQTIEQNPNKKLIYFTSILSETISNEYYHHKKVMEKAIEIRTKDYIIYRIPQLIGKICNKFNLIHFLKDSIENNKEITIYNGINRAIFDVQDLVNFVNYSKDKINRNYVNVSYIEKLSVLDLVNLISSIIGKNAIYKLLDGEGINWYSENSITTMEWILFNNIEMKGYTEKVLRKYL